MLRVCARCRYEWAEQALDAMSVEPRTDSALLVEMLRLRKQLDPGAPDAVALPTAEEQT
jgi:hypothetical protein